MKGRSKTKKEEGQRGRKVKDEVKGKERRKFKENRK